MGIILTHGTGSGTSSGSGAFTQTEKLALQMETEFIASQTSYYKELDYSDTDFLIDIDIWTDDTKTLKLFHKDLFYNSDENLDRTLLLRISDNAQLLKTFAYDINGNLASITVSAG
jgi:hypothetical protein